MAKRKSGQCWIAVDFDNTVVKDAFPGIGDPVPGALEWLRNYKSMGAKVVLWTIRSHAKQPKLPSSVLQPAIDYMLDNDVMLDNVNRRPGQIHYSSSPKIHADIYIDDKNAGTPLIVEGDIAYVDWGVIGPLVATRVRELLSID